MKSIKISMMFLALGVIPALADCKQSEIELSQAQKEFVPALEIYENLAKDMSDTRDRGSLVDAAIVANKNIIVAYEHVINSLEYLKSQGCMNGRKYQGCSVLNTVLAWRG